MLLVIMGHEWRRLRSDAATWLALGLLAVSIAYAAFNGARQMRHRDAAMLFFTQTEKDSIEKIRRQNIKITAEIESGGSRGTGMVEQTGVNADLSGLG